MQWYQSIGKLTALPRRELQPLWQLLLLQPGGRMIEDVHTHRVRQRLLDHKLYVVPATQREITRQCTPYYWRRPVVQTKGVERRHQYQAQ